jgi:cytochrome c oxidase subunit 3
MSHQNHPYHLVNPSPWPVVGALSMLAITFGTASAMHGHHLGVFLAIAGLAGVLYTMFGWWCDVVKEGAVDHAHTGPVRHGLRIGMALFIVSEIMFFAAFFWAFFSASLLPRLPLEDTWAILNGVWPPKGIVPFDPWSLPFLNTLVLLLSGTTVTWAHYALLHGQKKELVQALWYTVLLGILFTSCQAYEYTHAAFGFKDTIYASTFYMATGFHGFHVLIGTIFLSVCLIRAKKDQFSPEHHLGFEFAAWYWHFVDVVWLFLFVCVYCGFFNKILPALEVIFSGTNLLILLVLSIGVSTYVGVKVMRSGAVKLGGGHH